MKARFAWAAVLVMAVLAVLSASAYAAGDAPVAPLPGSGPETAGPPSKDWQPLVVDQRVWYAFDYAGDRSQIDVVVDQVPLGSVDFTVRTPADLKYWQDTGVERYVGEGHPDIGVNGALNWSGSFNAPGTYYVVVDHTNGDPSLHVLAAYLLKITGSGVSFRARRVAQQAPAPPPLPTAGSDPGSAVDATANSRGGTLGQGQVRWYAFDAAGDNSQITVRLRSNPPNKANFSVWTLQAVQIFNAFRVENPFGRSAPDSRFNGDHVWSGNLAARGKYYVRVEQTGTSAPVTYALQITQ